MNKRRRSALRSLFQRILLIQGDPMRHRLVVLEIQEELIERTLRTERRIRQSRATVKALGRELRAERGGVRIRQISAQLMRQKSTAETDQAYLEILRTIGDALAFIFGDRFDLKPLAFREGPGFLGGKKGARLERGIMRRAFELGHVAILNDLTHSLRHADLTLFGPGGMFALIEAKSGRGGSYSRNKRQIEAIRTMAGYLETDERQDGEATWRRVALQSDPRDHSSFVTNTLRHLPAEGWSFTEVEPGLYYLLVDGTAGSFDPLAALIKLDKNRRFQLLSSNDLKYERMGYTPFPLLIRDADLLCRFYAGELVINLLVCIDRVNDLLRKHDLSITPHDNFYAHWEVHDHAMKDATSFVSAHFVQRLSAEFVTLEWLTESIANSQRVFASQRNELN